MLRPLTVPKAPEDPPLPKALKTESGKAVELNPTEQASVPFQHRPVVPPKVPLSLFQIMSTDDKWTFVPCQSKFFSTPEYRHDLLQKFGRFTAESKATTQEKIMSDFYEGAAGTTPLYVYGFHWQPLLEYIFSSQSFLSYCQDEPPFNPKFDAALKKTDWSSCEQALSWLRPLDDTCTWHREVFNDRDDNGSWSW